MKARRVGLISDTHGLLRPEAVRALEDCELIVHAGDIGGGHAAKADPAGKSEILQRLGEIAPVVAVRGNVDSAPWAAKLPETVVAEAGDASFYVLHDLKMLDLDPAAAGFHVVVSGHSHQPGRTERGGVLYVNPGSAGPRRFSLPVTVARMDLSAKPWSVEFIRLF